MVTRSLGRLCARVLLDERSLQLKVHSGSLCRSTNVIICTSCPIVSVDGKGDDGQLQEEEEDVEALEERRFPP
jgi:hypothetical protein